MSRLLLFDPYAGGHHADHIRWIAEAWQARAMDGELVLSVSPDLLREAPALRDLERPGTEGAVRIAPLGKVVHSSSLLAAGRIARRLLAEHVGTHAPDRALAMYMDHTQLALATRVRIPAQTELSGILFRPDLHYTALGSPPETTAERVQRLRKRLLLRAALAHPRLRDVFTLDPLAVAPMQRLTSGTRIHHLPDPAHIAPPEAPPAEVRRQFGVEPERFVALLFGSISERKGALVLAEALSRLPDDVARSLAVVLAGRIVPDIREPLETALAPVREKGLVQVIVRDAFLPDGEVQGVVASADLILVPYQHHVGSSGVLMRAAAAGVPVLAQSWGLMGTQVREHALGLAVVATEPEAVAQGLQRAIEAPGAGFDPQRAAAFAEAHTVDTYVDTLFAALFPGRTA